MDNAIALDQSPYFFGGFSLGRIIFVITFIVGGLVLLYLANRHVRRHHKKHPHRRY